MDYFSHTQRNARALLEKLASTEPATLAVCMAAAWHRRWVTNCCVMLDSLPSDAIGPAQMDRSRRCRVGSSD